MQHFFFKCGPYAELLGPSTKLGIDGHTHTIVS